MTDAASFITVADRLRVLDRGAYNAAYEVWRLVARVPPDARPRIIEELDPGALC